MSNDSQNSEISPGIGIGWSAQHGTRNAGTHARFFLERLEPGMHVLDCGCGPGSITIGIAEAVAPGRVVGVDLSPSRVEEASALARQAGLDNVEFYVGDIYQLQFGDNSFDAAYEHAVFQHLNDPGRAAEEVLRVLKPSGFFGASDRIRTATIVFGDGMDDVKTHSDIGIEEAATTRGSDLDRGMRLHTILKQAGFVDVAMSAAYEVWTGEQLSQAMRSWADQISDPSWLAWMQQAGHGDQQTINQQLHSFRSFANDPDAYIAATNGEALGWKKAAG